ncbi:Na+/H+ antiporter subunit E [Haloferula sp. A504]|uniref:Na+/H+ antiporter subunit E n=1 Tax=Haloferula sp. A504 TaxID=3373601 RepID=UPI0031BBD460|nr:Na+/H+ antiporter subunit E [Verrucomicrobiaceae bacterium E54]
MRRLSVEAVLAWSALFVMWVILSGKFDAFHLGCGVVTVGALIWMHRALEPFRPHGSGEIRLRRLVPYMFWLAKEMLVAAVHVAIVILRPKGRLDPRLIRFESEQPTLLNAVIFGHSITLTPGTITLDLEDDRYLVHALTPGVARDVIEGSMHRRVARLTSDRPVATPRLLPHSDPTAP